VFKLCKTLKTMQFQIREEWELPDNRGVEGILILAILNYEISENC